MVLINMISIRDISLRGNSNSSGITALLLSVIFALVFVFKTFGVDFVLGKSPYWMTEVDDVTQYIAGFNMYFTAPWKFPLLAFDSLNYPQGTRVTFVDAIPLYALFLKAVLPTSLAPLNPFGVWVALSFILQAVSAWWIARELRIRSWAFLGALLVILLTYPALMARLGHISLMSHWILLFALALYIRRDRSGKWPCYAWSTLLFCGFYVNVYLFVMACGIYLASFLVAGFRPDWRSALKFILPFLALLASGFLLLLPFPAGEVTREWGFGYYSMNLLSPFSGGRIFQLQVEEVAGQFEGFNYLGLGVILASFAALALSRTQDRSFFKRHWPLFLLMAGYSFYALSNQIYFGGKQVLVIRYPEVFGAITSQFRASGRFFWPVGYCIIVFSFLMLYRSLKPRVFVIVAIILVILQIGDLKDRYSILKTVAHRQHDSRLNRAAWNLAVESNIQNLYFYPKFKCGKTPPHDTLLPVMRYAAEQRLNLNTGYIARYTPRCDDIALEIAGSSHANSIYVFVRNEFNDLNTIKMLFPAYAAPECKEVDFAFICQSRMN